VPHFSSFPVALSSLSLSCLFIQSFFLSLILSLPSFTCSLIINVSVRKRGKMCEISHRDFFFLLTAGVCLGLTRSYAISTTHTHTHTHTHQPLHSCTLPLQHCIALVRQLDTIVAVIQGGRNHPLAFSELLSHSPLVNFELEQFTFFLNCHVFLEYCLSDYFCFFVIVFVFYSLDSIIIIVTPKCI